MFAVFFVLVSPLKICPSGSKIVLVLILIVSASLGHMMGEVSSGGYLCEMTGHKLHFYYDLFELDDFVEMEIHLNQEQSVEPAREPCWSSVSQETLRPPG